MFESFRALIKAYEHYDTGIGDDYDIFILDTGSSVPGYDEFITNKLAENPRLHKLNIPNNGGCFASMKYLMHHNPDLANQYEYVLFSVDDDGGYPIQDGWVVDLVDKYTTSPKVGVMGRYLDTIRLGPTGLVDHRNTCPHVAKIWGVTEVTSVPHLHANWFFMTSQVLSDLGSVWYAPVKSEEGMAYQQKWENEDFFKLADMRDNRKTLDNVHIGRETDMTLRFSLIDKQGLSYEGTSFYPNVVQPYKKWKSRTLIIPGFQGEYKYED